MRKTIITCDLCGGQINTRAITQFSLESGAVRIKARQLSMAIGLLSMQPYNKWKRRVFHICPDCVAKLKEYCGGDKAKAEGFIWTPPPLPSIRRKYKTRAEKGEQDE